MSSGTDAILRGLTGLACRIDAAALREIPRKGPLILVTNHVNFLEIPIIRSRMPRHHMTGLVKAETWENPLMAWLFSQWQAIPIQRETTDFQALGAGLRALHEGRILAIAPEGTRSHDGCLRQAHTGVSVLALRSGAPILPLVCFGQEAFFRDLSRGRRTPVTLRVGHPFRLIASCSRPDHQERQEITSQIMYQLAALLPASRRGYYADMSRQRTDHLQFS